MRKAVRLTLLLACTIALSGCLQVHRPVVDSSILANADHDWVVTEGEVEAGRDLAPRAVETEYRYDPGQGDSGYPGLLVLVGLRSLQRIDEHDLVAAAREILEDEMAERGGQADSVTEETGARVLESGAATRWLTMTGTASNNAFLFAGAREIRVLAEAWDDEESKMHVVAIAIAQTVQTGFVGNEQRDHGAWNELVGDADGSIGGAIHPEGFIDHAVIQN